MPPINGPANPDHVAERDQPPCPAPQFGPFTEALKGPTETRKEVRHRPKPSTSCSRKSRPPGTKPSPCRRMQTRPRSGGGSAGLIYHPDKGGQPDLMGRVNAAYERAQRDWSR
jgi:hypothetical protein